MSHNLSYLTVIALLLAPIAADAQHRRGPARQGTQSPRAAAIAPPKGLAQALLPAGARRLPTSPANARHANWKRWPQTKPSWRSHQRFDRYPRGSYYGVPSGGYFFDAGVAAEEERGAEPEPITEAANKGLLRFVITPASGLEYYIDGSYFGSSSTIGSEFEVNAGARQIEVRARGYKSATFDARIEEGRVTTLRSALEAAVEAQAPRSTGGRVMYVIPGCYIGNAKPEASALPAGCDVKKMVTRGGGL